MKRILNISLALMLVLFSLQQLKAFDFTLSGQVLGTELLIPVANQQVKLHIHQTQIFETTLTGEDGTYNFTVMIPDSGSFSYVVKTFDDCVHHYIVRDGEVTPEGAIEDFVICENGGGGQFGCEANFEWHQSNHTLFKVYFEDKSDFQPGTWAWDFGDGGTSPEKNPFHIYATGGEYTVTLTINGADSTCVDTYSEVVVIEGGQQFGCEAAFTWNTHPHHPLKVMFHDKSDFLPGTWYWEFGDGETSNFKHPQHTYAVAGEYNVTLTIHGADSTCFDTYSELIVVEGGGGGQYGCEADFDWHQSNNTPFKVYFEDKSDFLPGTWYWEFGDGESSVVKNPFHIYATGGEYTVTLTINGADSTCFDTYSELVVILDSTFSCQANFWWHYNCQNTNPLEIQFVNNSYSYGPIVEFAWDFGDGATSNQGDPLHVYSDFGLYSVTLGIITESGCTSSKTLDVWVNDPSSNCLAMFVPFIDSINPLQVYFEDLSIGQISSWLWEFGDGAASIEQNPTHIYPEQAVYNASLTIEVGDICTSSFYYEINLITGQVAVSHGPTTGIIETNDITVTLYPNPVEDVLFINTTGNSEITIQIMNLSGQVLRISTQRTVDVSDLPKGVYFASVNVDGKIVNSKFIK